MFKRILILFLFFIALLGHSQNVELSPLSKISLLTVGTGEDLAAKFGHSAIRLQDPTLGIDEVYGYGTYDFEDPNFYLNFTRGKLSYTISRIPFKYFDYSYQQEKRWIREQILDVNLEQRNQIVTFLEHNLLPENKKYKYDFLFDNCATRIPMVFEKTLGSTFNFDYNYLEDQLTFRELIRLKLNPNSWSNFGIDLALGSVIDREATPYEHLFLPIYVYEQMKHSTLNGKPIVKSESVILDIPEQEYRSLIFLTPLFWLFILLVLVCYITYTDFKNLRRNKWLDFGLFAVTGLAGVLILFLWFGTDHLATKANFNSLWAFAPNVIIAFIMIKKQIPSWMITYIIFLIILLGITCILWMFKIQVFSILLIIVLLALAIRYLYLIYYFKSTYLAKK
ncbi:lipoprotein N-acyltransferase Lnb domain-containing protein [Maribacter spongiicola]|uniref:lipoprotein N-acyltransferase Lnb domain-containing protein n=1 Tax=Maribacter spongiicola TaxID=1206753 RepID=UPI003F9C1D67